MSLDQVWIALFGVSAVFLVNMHSPKVSRWGCIMGMISQPAWFYSAYMADQWGIFVLCVFYTYSWGMGVYNNWVRTKA